jgi:hypothetical protein
MRARLAEKREGPGAASFPGAMHFLILMSLRGADREGLALLVMYGPPRGFLTVLFQPDGRIQRLCQGRRSWLPLRRAVQTNNGGVSSTRRGSEFGQISRAAYKLVDGSDLLIALPKVFLIGRLCTLFYLEMSRKIAIPQINWSGISPGCIGLQ